MIISREFNLMGNRRDSQYVSYIDSRGYPRGYDSDIKYALRLTPWQVQRCSAFLRDIGAKFIKLDSSAV